MIGESAIQRAVKLLEESAAPPRAALDLKEIVRVANEIERAEGRQPEPLMTYLVEVCLRHGVVGPFMKKEGGDSVFLRPYCVDHTHPLHRSDTGRDNSPNEEQSYRRGYDQGFSAAKTEALTEAQKVVGKVLKSNDIEQIRLSLDEHQTKIHQWRVRPIQVMGSLPGSEESIDLPSLTASRNVPAKLRYRILERDKFTCVACGKRSGDGIELEVDHKISLRDGGGNEETNLQTLCQMCNRGKGAQSQQC